MDAKQANAILPSKPTSSKVDPCNLTILLIGPPKWGKTKFFMSNPNAVLLAFEEGHKFQRGYKIVIDKWEQKKGYTIKKDSEGCPHMTAMQAVEVLEASDRFDFVIIDTVDMAVKMCSDHFCEQGRVDHPADLGDYGKGWDLAQNSPMRKAILRILKTGRGVGLITHTKLEIQKFTSGEKARKESTLPAGVKRFVESQADVIMHGELGMKQSGNRLRDRVLVCEGDMDTLAGNRTGSLIPNRYIVDPINPWKQFRTFFNDPNAAAKAEAEYRKLTKGKK